MLFISHAVKDKPVIDKFFNLLQTGAGVLLDEAFVSSVSGADIPPGNDFVDHAKKNLIKSKLVILFITPNYYKSRFCIAELGAAWIQEKDIFPLVAPDLEREIGDNMLGTQTERVNRTGLNKLFDQLKRTMPERKYDTERWELMRKDFLSEFEELYEKLPKPEKVERQELDRAEKRASTAMEIRREAESKVKRLKQQVRELERAKDAQEVKEIRKKHSNEDEQFEAYLEEVKDEMDDLNNAVIRAIYASYTANDWSPTGQAWSSWRKELERGMDNRRIQSDGRNNPNYLSADTNHPEVERAMNALRDLDHFLSSEASHTFCTLLTEEYDIPIDLKNREFWEKVLLDGSELPE